MNPNTHVLMGTCGWSDTTLLRCKRFYPPSAKSNIDRLLHYSRYFPCVEVDTSNYAIPTIDQITKWVNTVPQGFKFHFKAFGLFTNRSIAFNALPREIKDKLMYGHELSSVQLEKQEDYNESKATEKQLALTRFKQANNDTIHWNEIPSNLQERVWEIYLQVLDSIANPTNHEDALGCVLFQFPFEFTPPSSWGHNLSSPSSSTSTSSSSSSSSSPPYISLSIGQKSDQVGSILYDLSMELKLYFSK